MAIVACNDHTKQKVRYKVFQNEPPMIYTGFILYAKRQRTKENISGVPKHELLSIPKNVFWDTRYL